MYVRSAVEADLLRMNPNRPIEELIPDTYEALGGERGI
jgi:hypothetical protein